MSDELERTVDPVLGAPVRWQDDPRTWKREYMREYRRGLRRIRPLEERLLAGLDMLHGPVIRPELGPCWQWTGATNSDGYGLISDAGVNLLVHRVTLAIALGRPIAEGMHACHRCDNRVCARPAHLYEGTPAENVYDTISRDRRRIVAEERRRAAEPCQPKGFEDRCIVHESPMDVDGRCVVARKS